MISSNIHQFQNQEIPAFQAQVSYRIQIQEN